jgi:molybdopterin molybdotransferase
MKFTLDEALARILAAARPLGRTETVLLDEARGRVLAAALVAPSDQPAGDVSRMDGYALRAADAGATGASLPVLQRIAAGRVGTALAPASAARIFTGALLPAGADCVVPQEDAHVAGDAVEVPGPLQAGKWVRRAGSEMQRGEVLLPAGTGLGEREIALACSVGCDRLAVSARPVVALLCTGSELSPPGRPLPPGAVYNSNRDMLRALLLSLGCEVRDQGILPDDREATRAGLAQAAQGADLVLTSGGVSVGDEDHVRGAMEQDGVVDVWQVAMKPGKPVLFGHLGDASVLGLPGNPASCFVTFVLLVRPFLLRRMGVLAVAPRTLTLRAGFDRAAGEPRREFLRARASDEGVVEIHPDQGPASLVPLAWAEGLVDAPAGVAIAPGDPVRYLPLASLVGGP